MSEPVIPERHQTRFKLAMAQLALFDGVPTKEEWEGTISYCSEVIELLKELGAAEAKVAELEAHQVTFEIEDKLMEAEFLRSQFDALGIVVETSFEEFGEGKKATTRTTINKRADDLEAKVAEQAATIAEREAERDHLLDTCKYNFDEFKKANEQMAATIERLTGVLQRITTCTGKKVLDPYAGWDLVYEYRRWADAALSKQEPPA